MKVEVVVKKGFSVLGIEGRGLSSQGQQWVPPLWKEASSRFAEVENMVHKDEQGAVFMWGAMTDVDDNFEPWKEEGKYLAGCEVDDHVSPPEGWTLWKIPGFKYIVVNCEQKTYGEVFSYMLKTYLPENKLQLSGAVHECYPPGCNEGEVQLYFPIVRLY